MITFDELPLFRATDPNTSAAAAKNVMANRRVTQLEALLRAYEANWKGLTDEEAGTIACKTVVASGYWKRSADLRSLGLIMPTRTTRKTSSGCNAMVCVITQDGLDKLAGNK